MSKRIKQAFSIMVAAALLLPSGWLAREAHADAGGPGQPVTVYHETFADGAGKATKSGNASLMQVTGKAFDGSENGNALYVSGRVKNWDAADFKFTDIGLENGKTYKVTAAVYVDADTTLPDGAKAALQTVEGYQNYAEATYEAGKTVILTKEFTVDTKNDSALRINSNEAGAAVPYYIRDLLITTQQTAGTTEKEVYHETFADGAGKATKSGNASLKQVTGKAFDGSENGNALYVSDRVKNWDAADFKFTDIGLENGKTYKVTAAIYVDADAVLPDGAKAALQTVESYQNYAEATYEAGKTVILTKEFTVDKSKDSALRINSNEAGAAVPYYIRDILITERISSGGQEETPRNPALPFNTITFEDQTQGGFEGRAGTETLTVTNEANHTTDGSYALKVEGRTTTWHGPSLRIEKYVDKGSEYKISAWVKLISPASSQLQLSTQIGTGSSANYVALAPKTINASDGWVQFEGTYRYNSVGDEYLTIYVESSNNATASFYIDDISFEKTSAVPIEIQKDLTPIRTAYQNDFLIGNAISAEDLEGVRLELLTMHHNVATAGNAMKPDALQPTKGNFTFTAADAMVDKILAEGMKMHGHVLVWHQQSPAWMNTTKDAQGNTIPLKREEALANLRSHIRSVMEHFGNKVISWDVVNEAMNDNPPNPADWKASLRQSPWYQAIGPDYLEQAFLAAREVLDEHPEWNIKLYYNDYNEDNQNKAQAIYNMVKELNDGYAKTHPGKRLVDGVGMQGHYNVNTNPENVKLSLEKFISLGVEVSISELDIQAGSNYQLPEKLANAQGYLYAQLMKIFKDHAASISRVTFWGMDDNTSWRASSNPLLFDKNLQAKPAYYGVIDPETFMAAHQPETGNANESSAVYGTPAIDGTVDAIWNQAPAMPINRYQMAWQGATGVAKALWDDQNLYVLIQVSDAQLDQSSANVWEQDSVEIFVDENNAKTTFYQDDDGQYRVNFDNKTSFNPEKIAAGFESATRVSGTNYTVEVKIPFKSITPANLKKIGFDAQINDAKDGARQSVAAWNDTTGNGYQDTSVFGVLTLTGKPANPGNNGPGNGGDGGGSGGSTPGGNGTNPQTVISVSGNGVVTIKPEVKVVGGHAVSAITGDILKKALEQAVPTTNGKKQIIIDIAKQKDVASYDIQLPTSSLSGQENFGLILKTENGIVRIPSNMLSNMKVTSEQISIRIGTASTDGLNAAARERIGSRPMIDLSILAGGQNLKWNNPKAPVTVMIPYTPTTEELKHPEHIVVWYIDGSGSKVPVPNGRYDVAAGAVVFQTTHFSTYAVANVSKTFGDLRSVAWAEQAIDTIAARDVIQGTAEGLFSPEAPVTRADFVALLVRSLELKGTGITQATFFDVDQATYYNSELATALELGLVTGYDGHTFKPGSPISRQDMMVMTARALAAAGKPVSGSGEALDAYSDAASISAYAKDSASALVQSGIVIGDHGKIAPNDTLTRAEAAVILYRIWNQ
ncbi:endo-1,4-beta-xylanase [Paenibacillus chibensis]|uniref:Beta-xylanase n=1 Tax=Paenibacillus chibensis TaxID=59846 RepID=A0ABU6PZ67_9BACL|nr:endo-1,4-beta-xylanase [Paenibacillus chibensis]